METGKLGLRTIQSERGIWRTRLDDIIPPLGLTDDVDKVVGGNASLQYWSTTSCVVQSDGRPRRHVANDDDQHTTQILEEIFVADLDSMSLSRLEFGKNTTNTAQSVATRHSFFSASPFC